MHYNNLIKHDGKSAIDVLYEINEVEQESISKCFYSDYKQTRHHLFRHLKEVNEGLDELLLFEKSHKLMDRFIFVCFCEDSGLLPDNIFRKVVDAAHNSFDLSTERIWSQLKGLFHSIDRGNPPHDINKFNGGLFAPDQELDHLIIHDEIFSELGSIASYDFGSDLNVNILGHIFEQSISDVEEIKAQITDKAFEKSEGKRKKDGIYYTPEYITRYMVEQAIGGWLEERRIELGEERLPVLPEESPNMTPAQKSARTKALKQHIFFWEEYREQLKNIKVLDAACGSGAFLNQAFDYLYHEGQRVRDIIAGLQSGQSTIFDLDKHILQHNLFGVDLNEESVEITKLSLWIKTANKHSELTSLDRNILCGNSLIADSSVAGERAFDWNIGFSDIMKSGGFDVIIGNPPWGAKLDPESKRYLKENYPFSAKGKVDTYKYFIEKTFLLTKSNAYVCMITPNTFLYNVQSDDIRRGILEHFNIVEGIELRKNIFEDAPDVVPAILLLKRGRTDSNRIRARVAYHNQRVQDLSINDWMLDQKIPQNVFESDPEMKINLRLNMGFLSLKARIERENPNVDAYFDLKQGTKPYGDKDEKEIELISKEPKGQAWDKALNGRNIGRYSIRFEGDYVWRCEQLHSCLSDEILASEKIYFQRMRKISLYPRIVATYDDGQFHGLYTCSVIYSKASNVGQVKIKYLLCLLNSNLINRWYQNFDTDVEIKLESVKRVPVVVATQEIQNSFVERADKMLGLARALDTRIRRFGGYIIQRLSPHEVSRKLTGFFLLSYKEFLTELKKQKVRLTEKETYELMEVFEDEKSKVEIILHQIRTVDLEIDEMVYKLYGLTTEEIAAVRGLELDPTTEV